MRSFSGSEKLFFSAIRVLSWASFSRSSGSFSNWLSETMSSSRCFKRVSDSGSSFSLLLLMSFCFWRWLASSGGQKLSVSPLPFKRSIYRLERSSATPISDPPKFHLFAPLRTTEPPKFAKTFGPFSTFRPFSGGADSDVPPKP